MKKMKTKYTSYLLAVGAAAVSLSVTASYAQVFDPTEALTNRAIAVSPRAIEVFPWLTLKQTAGAREANALHSKTALAEVKENSALAASPRMREVFPKLARTRASESDRAIVKQPGIDPLSEARRNRAVAASPRMREVFPSLARGEPSESTAKSFLVAPLK
jgi:hypothetical protein